MISKTRAAVVGFTLAMLYLLCVVGPLVSPAHELIFHLPGAPTLLFLPAVLDVLLLSALLILLLLWARHHRRAELFCWSGLLLSLPSGLIATGYGFRGRPVPPQLGWPVAIAAFVIFLAVNATPKAALPRFARVRSAAALVLGFLALPELLLLLQLCWYGWQARHLNPPFTPAPQLVSRDGATQTRIVWLLLDELSFDQLLGHRFAGLALPNFDRLASQSVVFDHVTPAAEYTRTAVPAMLTGYPLARTQPSADGHTLSLTLTSPRSRRTLQPADTVFGDAQQLGLPTSVAGWYEPYCRLLPGVLNHCFWTYSDEPPPGMSVTGTVLGNTLAPFAHFAQLCLRTAHLGPAMPTRGALDVHRHHADYDALLSASDALLNSGQTGLILLHMPIPHPWGFYDRHTGTFPQHRTSYLDNLSLADTYIGRVREELERRGEWDNTSVLVMGDHSWRTSFVWAPSDHWTGEEQAASHGGAYDSRPALLLKLPGQQKRATVSTPFNAVRTRALLDVLMTQHITPFQLQQWVSASPAPQPLFQSKPPAR